MKIRRLVLIQALALFGAAAGAFACSSAPDDIESADGAMSVDAARSSGDAAAMAKVLHRLVADRIGRRADRVEGTQRLVDGLSVKEVDGIRASYIDQYNEDPEITIRSDGLFRPLVRLDRDEELELVSALNAARMGEIIDQLKDQFARAKTGALTTADREVYFSTLPRLGLWDAPVRAAAGDSRLDALERVQLKRTWAARGGSGDLDTALRTIESKLPLRTPAASVPRSRSIAVVASSHGAQWQELMGWAKGMLERGYQLQLFTPDGRPAGFQRDSLSVSKSTVSLGFGCPPDLDPAKTAGKMASDILSRAVGAAAFDASQYGAVYLAGGLGFNEDVAVAEPSSSARSGTALTANANIRSLMDKAIAERLPLVAICHGPTLFAAIPMVVDGKEEPIAKNIETASLPPFESYVKLTERKEIQFTYDVNTHKVLSEAGAKTNVLGDIAQMTRVVRSRKADIDIITGPGPQTADRLVEPTIEAIGRRWGSK